MSSFLLFEVGFFGSKKKEGNFLIDPFDEIMIRNYLSFPTIFRSLHQYKKRIRQEFYLRNMSTHIEFSKLGIGVTGFRPDREVEKLLLKIDMVSHRIDRYRFREKHFTAFLKTLDPVEQKLLAERFSCDKAIICPQNLIDSVLYEISEIESALCFRQGIEPLEDDYAVLTEDVDENVDRMCDFFAL